MSDKQQVDAALSKLKKLVEQGKYREAWMGCDEVLALDSGNEVAAQLKREIEERGLLMKQTASKGFSVSTLTCPRCSASLSIHSAEAESITCSSCGAVTNIEDGNVIASVQANMFPPYSFISLGDEGEFFGKKYQVIGRVRCRADLKEWDSEDKRYYTEPWTYDEWVLVGESKEYAYLYEDSESWAFVEPFTPSKPNLPKPTQTRMSLETGHPEQRLDEFADARISYFEGEFTWTPKAGERIHSFEYTYGHQSFSVEARLGDDGKPVEVEFFKSTPQSRLDIARAFGKQQILKEEQEKQEAKAEAKKWANGFFAAGALLLVLLVGSLFSGSVVAEYSFSFNQATPDEGVIRGPFALTKTGAVHTLELSTSIRDNSWSWGAVELLDEQQTPISAVDGEFWRESGYDSDGRWSESDTSRDYHFTLENPGQYYIRLLSEAGSAGSGKLRVRVLESVTLSRYYVAAMLLCFGYAFAIRRYRSLNPWYAFAGILLLGLFLVKAMGEDD